MLLQSERPTRTASGLRCSQKPTHGLIRQSYRAKFKSVRIQATVREHSAEASGHQRVLSLALKEWAVTCAALGKGDQTVCAAGTPLCLNKILRLACANVTVLMSRIFLADHITKGRYPRINLQSTSRYISAFPHFIPQQG